MDPTPRSAILRGINAITGPTPGTRHALPLLGPGQPGGHSLVPRDLPLRAPGVSVWRGSGDRAHYEHRRGWIVARMEQLAGVFAVDVAAYAVMSNHFHQVVRVDAERARK